MDINERLVKLRTALNINQSTFAAKINRAQSTYSEYERGKNIPDRTISDICRVFNVNEEWLKNGEGPMFRPAKGLNGELTSEIGALIASEDDFTKKLILRYLQLPEEEKKLFEKFIRNLDQ